MSLGISEIFHYLVPGFRGFYATLAPARTCPDVGTLARSDVVFQDSMSVHGTGLDVIFPGIHYKTYGYVSVSIRISLQLQNCVPMYR